MEYFDIVTLKDGRECTLRSGTSEDGRQSLDLFILSHEQTDFLLSYPDEITFTAEEQGEYLQKKTESENEVEILAFIGERLVGTAGVEQRSPKAKLRHRCDFGISVDQAYWGFGVGRALMNAAIACARKAGYEQMELEVVAENTAAVRLYESVGFIEFGRNPRDFKSRYTGYQEVIYMRLELD